MPAAVASRNRDQGSKSSSARRGAPPPTKKTKLSQQPAASRPNGLQSLLNGSAKSSTPAQAKVNGVKKPRRERVEEATAVVGGALADNGDVDMEDAGKEVIEISSGVEESDISSSEDEDAERPGSGALEKESSKINGEVHGEDLAIEDGPAEAEELSFGERLQAQAPHVVDVEATFAGANADSRALATASNNRTLSAPSASSLGTVLTQALRTNDQELLESCLRVIDVDTIYATVERLPSPLVGSLLQKLAERLHKKPGRAGMLMVWVQWSLAAHGGYLASQPQLVKQLATLTKVLKERASGLQPLLALKGRLDMIHAQLELRKRNQRKAAHEEEDEAIIYVEGEDDFTSAEEDNESGIGSPRKRIRQDSEGEDESSEDEMPTTMEAELDESDEGSEDSEGLVDDEAEETDNDSGDELSEPMSDDEADVDDGSASEEETKPTRRSTASRAGLARRY